MTQKRKNRGQTSLNGEVVQAFLSRFPNTASKTLAEMIYKEHSQLFTDVEHARSRVRYYRGALGKKNRNRIIEKEHFRVTDTFNPFNLPEPDESRQVLPFKLPADWNNALILSDIHMPYHDLPALTAAIEYGIKNKVPGIILNGDTMDFFAASRFAKDPTKTQTRPRNRASTGVRKDLIPAIQEKALEGRQSRGKMEEIPLDQGPGINRRGDIRARKHTPAGGKRVALRRQPGGNPHRAALHDRTRPRVL